MTTLRVEINRDRDLPALKALLSRLGLKYYLEDDEWDDLSEAEIEGIEAGLKDVKEGRVYSHSDAVAGIDKKSDMVGKSPEGIRYAARLPRHSPTLSSFLYHQMA